MVRCQARLVPPCVIPALARLRPILRMFSGSSVSLRLAAVPASLWLAVPCRNCQLCSCYLPFAPTPDCVKFTQDARKPHSSGFAGTETPRHQDLFKKSPSLDGWPGHRACGRSPISKRQQPKPAAPTIHVEPPLFEVNVLDSQVQRFANSQTAPVEQVHDEPGRVTVEIADRQQLAHFLWTGSVMDRDGPFGAEGIHRSQFGLEDISVEEQQPIEGLVLVVPAETPLWARPVRKAPILRSSRLKHF